MLGAATIVMMCITAVAQEITPYRGVVKDGYNFLLLRPAINTGRPKPLIIFLHGSSLCGNNLNRVLRYGTMAAVKKGLALDAYVLAPQNPGGSWNPRKIMNDVEWVEANNSIDTTRVYVLGMSLGGYGTLDFASAYPEKIAAAMALCGGATSKDVAQLNQMPLWIVHGTADRAVSIRESDKVVAKMKRADPKLPRLIYDRVTGMNHGQPARIFYMPDTYRWLLSHSLTDEGRKVKDGFKLTSAKLRDAYRSLRAHKGVIAVPVVYDAIPDIPESCLRQWLYDLQPCDFIPVIPLQTN